MTTQIRSNARLGFSALVIAVLGLSVSASAQSRRNGAGITVYTNPDFSGQSASFRDDTPTLVPYGLNDKISSIDIPNGETWEVCQDVNYGNRCQVLSGSVSDLRSMGWNDRISSLRRINNGGFRGRQSGNVYGNNGGYRDPRSTGVQQGLLFYDRPGFRGSSRLVTGNSSNVGFSARQGSVELRGGGPWEVCDGSGRCVTLNRDVSDLSQLGLSGRITSVRQANNSQRYGSDGRNRRDNGDRYNGR
jgi:hypothetical protein